MPKLRAIKTYTPNGEYIRYLFVQNSFPNSFALKIMDLHGKKEVKLIDDTTTLRSIEELIITSGEHYSRQEYEKKGYEYPGCSFDPVIELAMGKRLASELRKRVRKLSDDNKIWIINFYDRVFEKYKLSL